MRFRGTVSLFGSIIIGLPACIGLVASSGSIAGAAVVPPRNPAVSIPFSQAFLLACQGASASAPGCLEVALPAIDAARATEGVGPMVLPTNWASLTIQEQVFVVVNLERVDRGLAPINGLSSALNTYAQEGAVASADPPFPPWTTEGGGNWSGDSNLWVADFGFMYADGPGGFNIDCSTPSDPGCWGHRTNILNDYHTPTFMGVGQTTTGLFGGSIDQEFLGADTHDTAYFTWGTEEALTLRGAAVGMSAVKLAGGRRGYFVVGAAGQVRAFGAAVWRGDMFGLDLNAPIVDIYATADGGGYYLLGADGGVYTFGDAVFHGSTGNMHLNAPIDGMAVAPNGRGYWLIAKDGGVFTFGGESFWGSTGSARLNAPVDGIAVAPGGRGYWLVARDGGVFTFTPNGFYGSHGGTLLNAPIIGMTSTVDGRGYTLVGSDGGVFNYGDSHFYGSLGGNQPRGGIVGIAATPDNMGYYLLGGSGSVYGFGPGAPYYGGAN